MATETTDAVRVEMTTGSTDMVHVEAVSAGYHGSTVLHDVEFTIGNGEILAAVGHNGAGKTTLLHTVAGLLRPTDGRILLDGRDVTKMAGHRRARAGVALVPQGRRVFASLTVAEHLAIALRAGGDDGWSRDRVLGLLPRLGERMRHRGGQLSGGEQQMLAIARALLTQPRLLLLDEPTEGLAPSIAIQIRDTIATLAKNGTTILLAAPLPDLPVAVADKIVVLTAGRLTTRFSGAAMREDSAPLLAELAVGGHAR